MKSYAALSRITVLLLVIGLLVIPTDAKSKKSKKGSEGYQFKVINEVKRTPVKNQYRTGTCWCFSTISYLESEILRVKNEEVDLSEMYVVRHTYPQKAINYIRLHGSANHSQGGQSHDVIDQVRRYGIVPEEVYDGMKIAEKRHNHGEMVSVLQGVVDGILKRSGRRVTPRWLEAYEAVLNVYLGTPPGTFTYKGTEYTPKRFAQSLGLNWDDYIELTSYTHHPFYQKCRLELPDNWTYNSDYYNVPMEDLEKIMNHALENGHSFVWDGDVSEKEFSSRDKGYAVVPLVDYEDRTQEEQKKDLGEPVKEKEITQEMRQETLDNFTTTDDHLMHVVGMAKDQNGTTFYLTKNSGGTDRANKGYVYMSRAYVLLKATAIFINKNALPGDIKAKLGL